MLLKKMNLTLWSAYMDSSPIGILIDVCIDIP